VIGRELTRLLVRALVAVVIVCQRPALSHDQGSLIEKGAPRRQMYLRIDDFSLTDHLGNAFSFRTLREKVVLAGFIYTTCPDVCPLITASMRLVQEGLRPDERKLVHLLSVTTDPEVDTPEVLKSYAQRYKADFSNWSFLTGDLPSLSGVWKAFGVKVQRKARGLVSHTTLTVVVDQKGVMRFAYYGVSPDQKMILRDLRSLLDKKGGL